MIETLDGRLALRLKRLRHEHHLSLDQLAETSGVSRATLSRLENASVSPTTEVLGKLCSAYGLTLSRLLAMVENRFDALIRRDAQVVWEDKETGFTRRVVSPPTQSLLGEVVQCNLAAAAQVTYEKPSIEGLEHHVILLSGGLWLTVDGDTHELRPGDCLRYHLNGATEFRADATSGAQYMLVLIDGRR